MTTANPNLLLAPMAAPPVAARSVAAATFCAHCTQPVPAGLVDEAAEHQFCCAGCRAVFETIHACGLDSYYRLRDAAEASLVPAAVSDSAYEAFDTPAFARLYVTADGATGDEAPRSVDLLLEGVTCAACVWLVERLPRVLPGVIAARLSLRQATVRITWDPARVRLSQIARALDHFGYKPHAAKGAAREAVVRRERRKRLVHLGVSFAIMGNVMLLALALYAGMWGGMEGPYVVFFRWLSAILGTISLAWPGSTFFKSAVTALRNRAMNLDVPIALALLVGGVAGLVNVVLNRGEIYFDSLTALVFLLLVGRWMQFRQQRRADAAVELLFSLTPSTAHVVTSSAAVEDVPTEALAAADLIEVRAGELIPADGVVESGRSAVDLALLTGEAVPVSVSPGEAVHAGAQNASGVLRVRVTQTGADTRVGQLMRLVERGVQEKPAIVQFADRVGAAFVVVVSLAAALTFAGWALLGHNLSAAVDHTVALLIVTCPCVLGLATPLTISITIGRLARRDILVKTGAALERLAQHGRVLLDKTGTLTLGKLTLIEWAGDDSIKPAVAAIERLSSHPIARAISGALAVESPTAVSVTDLSERHDGGISAKVDGDRFHVGSPAFIARHAEIPAELDCRRRELEHSGATVVLVARAGRAVALAALGDEVREDSARSVAELGEMGWTPSIISGDASVVVASVAGRVRIGPANAQGGVSPEEKLARVHNAGVAGARSSGMTMMIGDGVNDAAALAAADVGIAVHCGAEASLAAADVYIARPGLAPVVDLVKTARHTMGTIRRNLIVSLAYNLLAGTLAAAGVMTPLIAAIVMPVSSATVLSLAIASVGGRRAFGKSGATWK